MDKYIIELKDLVKYVISYLDQMLSQSYSSVHRLKLEELNKIKSYLQLVLNDLNLDDTYQIYCSHFLDLIKKENIIEIYNSIKNPKKRINYN